MFRNIDGYNFFKVEILFEVRDDERSDEVIVCCINVDRSVKFFFD